MQVLYLGRAPRTKETLPNFLKWSRVTRHPLVFRGLTGSQRTPGFWGVTLNMKFLEELRSSSDLGNFTILGRVNLKESRLGLELTWNVS